MFSGDLFNAQHFRNLFLLVLSHACCHPPISFGRSLPTIFLFLVVYCPFLLIPLYPVAVQLFLTGFSQRARLFSTPPFSHAPVPTLSRFLAPWPLCYFWPPRHFLLSRLFTADFDLTFLLGTPSFAFYCTCCFLCSSQTPNLPIYPAFTSFFLEPSTASQGPPDRSLKPSRRDMAGRSSLFPFSLPTRCTYSARF